MGAIRPPPRVKLIVGMLSADSDLLIRAQHHLQRLFGPIDLTSALWPFDSTDYYEDQMGPDLLRQFVAFAELIRPERLAEIKRQTNHLEQVLSDEAGGADSLRPVNLDPGYVTLGKLVLATTKDYSHRVCIGQGIYGEVTLHIHAGGWRAWPWTYPDYAAPTYHGFFTQVRERLKEQLSPARVERPGGREGPGGRT